MPLKKQPLNDNEIPIYDETLIYQPSESWKMHMWRTKESKFARFSLRARNRDTVIDKAKKHYHALMKQQLADKPYFSMTSKQGVEEYIRQRTKDMEAGLIVKGRPTTIKTHLEHWLNFLGKYTKLKKMERTDCEKYSHNRTKNKMKLPIGRIISLLLLPTTLYAQNSVERFEVEGGIIATRNMEIHGFNQANATEGWLKSGPTVRLEYWRVKENDWNYGVAYQPLALQYKDTLKSNLNNQGQVFNSGDSGTLDFQFPTVRFTGNKPIYQGENGSYIRVGGSAIVRNANVSLSAGGKSFSDTGLAVFPVINVEATKPLGQGYSFFTRSDFLPIIGENLFSNGFYDVFLGVKKKLDNGNDFDVGLRLFFGGYDPKKQDDYANKIFFNSLVARYNF